MEQNNAQRNSVQPGNNAPMWRGVQGGVDGYSSLPKSQCLRGRQPDPGAGALPGLAHHHRRRGLAAVRNNWLIPYGGALLLISLVALAIFYFARGPIGHEPAVDGRARSSASRPSSARALGQRDRLRAARDLRDRHGIRQVLPAAGDGPTLFGYFTYVLKNAAQLRRAGVRGVAGDHHRHLRRRTNSRRGDLSWLLSPARCSASAKEPPTYRFNAGEKVVFWTGVVVLGLVVVGSGLVLDKLVPNVVYERAQMQVRT